MARVLGVVGSPRRNGNTSILVATALEGAASEGAATETLFLGGLTIRQCDGCHACWRGKPCPKGDDMLPLFERIAASDAILFGTPVYWYGPTALMKAFLDRFVFFNCPENRAKIRGKAVALAVPFEEEDTDAATPLVGLFERSFRYLEVCPVGVLLAPGVGAAGEVRGKEEILGQARALGRTLARGDGEHGSER